ncbi:PremRNAsplicing factor ISY1 [Aplysia californica] [Fasciolopsis buskii]|uniref:PremRNAsplicing factor ISY1 [Aplysia californica] n=1 Tax=Fasciolopsis buskii TaxID=27845 RepID=A0A8E0RYZ2_9TREM|nr:PremRNAsplicing factor ISY1 [Aplysia californica] [Fasciolopsis buski]
MTALARWRAVYVDKVQEQKRRPFVVAECTSLKDALYYRRQIVHDISRKIAQIQNPSLGEYKLRDLNDDINKLVREKAHWEDHIKTLGGPDFKAEAPKMLEKEGKEVPGNRGYRYYGAARDLPGVRELFEEEPQPVARKSRGELMKMVDVAYYGNCDEDDGVIVPQETKYEQEYMARKVAEYKARRGDPNQKGPASRKASGIDDADEDDLDEENADSKNIYAAGDNPADDEIMRLYEAIDEEERTTGPNLPTAAQLTALGAELEEDEDEYIAMLNSRVSGKTMSSLGNIKRTFVAHVPVYTQQQVEASLLAQKKREILEKYMSDELIASMTQTGEILGMEDSNRSTDITDLAPSTQTAEQEVEEEEEN